jgi:hypothetical protein
VQLRDRHLWTVIEITGDPDSPKRSTRIDPAWARAQILQYGADNPWVLANVFGKFPSELAARRSSASAWSKRHASARP